MKWERSSVNFNLVSEEEIRRVEEEDINKLYIIDEEEKKNAMAAWKEKTDGCWKIISNQEMWFPVVNPRGKLKTK